MSDDEDKGKRDTAHANKSYIIIGTCQAVEITDIYDWIIFFYPRRYG